jgi:APA family basic amino acid/polyamine antiporter
VTTAGEGPRGLLRVLGLGFGVAVVVGAVVGTGILRAPGVVAQGVPDPGLILALWALGAAATAVDSMSTVELGAAIPSAGGPYVFAGRAFGPFGGFVCGWLDGGYLVLTTAYISVVVAEYLQRLGLFVFAPTGALAVFVVLFFGVLNALGTRVSGGVQNIGSALKVIALFVFAALCFSFDRDRQVAPVAAEAAGLGAAASLASIALAMNAIQQTYAGANAAVYFSEEVEKPEENVARAVFIGVAVIAAVYLAVNAAVLNVLTLPELAASNLPAADALEKVVGGGALAASAFALFSVAAVGNVGVMQQSRTLFAMSRNGQLPRALSLVARNGAPVGALALIVIVGAALASTGVYETLISVTAPIFAGVNIIVAVAAIRLRMTEPQLARPWRMPLFPWPSIVSILINGALFAFLVYSDFEHTRWSILFILAAAPLYWLLRARPRV